MSGPGVVAVRIRRGNVVFHVHGENRGSEGVWLAKEQVGGIYDSPVKSTWKTGAFQIGSNQKARKYEHRDMELGFHLIETITNTYEFNESAFRQIFDYELDRWSEDPQPTILEIETTLSGIRKLDVLMYEEPEFTADLDPIMQQYGNLIMKLRAGQPLWYADNQIDAFESAATSASGFVTVSNPTDQIMYQKWILTRGTWDLPDVQWVGDPGERVPGGDNAARIVEGITVTDINGGMTIDVDRGADLMFRDFNDTNALGQMGGTKIFNYPIPPYTPPTDLPVAYSGAPTGGARAELVMPLRYSRPWGMEPVTIATPMNPRPFTIRFTAPGTYEYQIPEWAEAVDVVLLGGGGGGDNGGLSLGDGGLPGAWHSVTLERGVGIPWTTTTITGVIGAGGFEASGSATTATATGMTAISAAGGAGAASGDFTGQGVTELMFNGERYQGGADQTIPGRQGNPSGGGGAGGWFFGNGGPGARGQAWFRAYRLGGS